MQLKQLEYLITSADVGSFKAASSVLYTTQPHISKTIKALEEELGVTLLNRLPYGVELTEEGKKVYDYAKEILRYVKKIEDVT